MLCKWECDVGELFVTGKKLSLSRLVRDRMLRKRRPEGNREQTVGRVAGVFDNPPGFPCTPPGVDILEGGKLTSNNVAGSSHDPLQSPAVASGAVSIPGGDAAGQDALHSAGVEGPEDSGARFPQFNSTPSVVTSTRDMSAPELNYKCLRNTCEYLCNRIISVI